MNKVLASMLLLAVWVGAVLATGTFSGYVYDHTANCNEGVKGASVYIYNENYEYEVTTGDDCSYSVNVEPGTYTLIAAKEGFYSSEWNATVNDGETLNHNFELTPAPASGNLLICAHNSDDQPVEGATVHVWNDDGNVNTTDETGEDGCADFSGIPQGSYYVTVQKEGYNDVYDDDVVVSGDVTKNYLMTRNGTLTVTVTDSVTGGPIENAHVTVKDSGNNTVAEGDTDTSGTYTTELVEGNYTVEITHEDYYDPAPYEITINPNETTTVNAQLEPLPLTIYGYVYDQYGDPVVDATVEVDSTECSPTTTNESGYYQLECPAGSYHLTAWKNGYYSAEADVSGDKGDTVEQNFTLQDYPDANITVTVQDTNDNAIANAHVVLERSTDGINWEQYAEGNTSDSGQITFTYVEANGSYRAYAEKEGYNTKYSDEITPEDGNAYNLLVKLTKNGSISGYVQDDVGSAVENANVTLSKDGEVIAWTLTGSDGYYEFTDVEEGDYDVTASKLYYNDASSTVTVCLDNLNPEVNLTLTSKKVNVTITVYGDDDGDGFNDGVIAGATVQVGEYNQTTNDSGVAVFENIPAGAYHVVIEADWYTTVEADNIYNENTAESYTLEKQGSFVGVATDWTDSPVANALIKAYSHESGTSVGYDITESDGSYTIEKLDAGVYDLRAIKGGCIPVIKYGNHIHVGQNTTVNFRLSCTSG